MIAAADKEERKLTSSYRLPADPLTGREATDEVNLPLVAFCYLVRRLTVCPFSIRICMWIFIDSL